MYILPLSISTSYKQARMQPQRFQMIAKTLKSLEGVLAEELRNIDAEEIEVGKRMVSFWGNKATLYKANLRLRTALRILKPIYQFKAHNPDELYEALRRFDWSKVMRSSQTFSVDTTVYSDSFSHSKYVGYRTKDAIVDYFREKEGKRPSVSLDKPDIYFNVHISHTEVTLSLDSSGESLHKRGYKEYQTEASINEVLAAGILLMAGWKGQCDLLDPMCGSGTFLIEAALIAKNIAPGIYRKGFAFEHWLDFDEDLFRSLYEDDSAEREFNHTIYGSDILRDAIRISGRNVERAGMGKHIQLDILPFQNRPKPEVPILLVMNPPYGERIQLASAEDFYAMIGERLKHNYAGSTAWVIAYKSEHFNSIGLRPSSRLEVSNGALDCELRAYDLFDGKREEFKSRPREPRFPQAKKSNTERQTSSSRRSRLDGNSSERAGRRGVHREERKSRASRPNERRSPKNEHKQSKGLSELERRGNFDKESKESRSSRDVKKEGTSRQGLWPRDRFKAQGGEWRGGQRPYKPSVVQVYRSDED